MFGYYEILLSVRYVILVFYSLSDPLTTPNAMYGIVVKCSDDPTTADNPVYGARIDATMETR